MGQRHVQRGVRVRCGEHRGPGQAGAPRGGEVLRGQRPRQVHGGAHHRGGGESGRGRHGRDHAGHVLVRHGRPDQRERRRRRLPPAGQVRAEVVQRGRESHGAVRVVGAVQQDLPPAVPRNRRVQQLQATRPAGRRIPLAACRRWHRGDPRGLEGVQQRIRRRDVGGLVASTEPDLCGPEPRQVNGQRVARPAQHRRRQGHGQRHVEPGAAPPHDRQGLPGRAGHGTVPAHDDGRLLPRDRRDGGAQPVRVIEADVRDHRHAAIPGVRGVEAATQPHLHQRHVGPHLREAAEHDRGQQLELGRRAQATRHAIGERQRLRHEAGEVLGRDRPSVHDDPLPVADEVGLGRLAHPVPCGPERGCDERDDAALAVGAGDERPADGEVRIAHRPEERADASQPQADPEAAARLDRREGCRVGEVATRGGRRRLAMGRVHSRLRSSS